MRCCRLRDQKSVARKAEVAICRFINGDAQSLPLPDASADVVSIAFGIRNVADPADRIRENSTASSAPAGG